MLFINSINVSFSIGFEQSKTIELYGIYRAAVSPVEKIDAKVSGCFIAAYEVYYKALGELYSSDNLECFIAKPIEIGDLVKKVKEELEELPLPP